MRLTDHVTFNFNNNIPTAAVFFDIEKAFDTLACWLRIWAGTQATVTVRLVVSLSATIVLNY
jgi:hypothetical protein